MPGLSRAPASWVASASHTMTPSHFSDERFEGLGALVITDSVTHGPGRRDAPHLPGFGRLSVEARPARLVEPDDGLGERVFEEIDAGPRKTMSERGELIPQHLEAASWRIAMASEVESSWR